MKTRLLISGFEPFGGESMNPSAELVADCGWLKAVLKNTEIEIAKLPVRFDDAFMVLQQRVKDCDPHVVIALGQAGGRDKINVERVAINFVDADIADNGGRRPVDRVVVEGGPSAFFSTLPLRAMVEAANGVGVAAVISNSAGTYVCNHVLYRLLESSVYSTRRCGFIHLPYLPEQARGKTPAPPTMSLDEMKRGLSAMLKVFDAGVVIG